MKVFENKIFDKYLIIQFTVHAGFISLDFHTEHSHTVIQVLYNAYRYRTSMKYVLVLHTDISVHFVSTPNICHITPDGSVVEHKIIQPRTRVHFSISLFGPVKSYNLGPRSTFSSPSSAQ